MSLSNRAAQSFIFLIGNRIDDLRMRFMINPEVEVEDIINEIDDIITICTALKDKTDKTDN